MKRNLIIALVLTLMAGTAIAQQGQPGAGPGQGGPGSNQAGPGNFQGNFQAGPGNCQMPDPGQQISERLGLDEEQTGQVAAIMEEVRLQREAIRETAREEYCATRTNLETEMALVLTPEQFELWLTMRNQHERRGGNQGRHGPFDPGFECDLAPVPADGS